MVPFCTFFSFIQWKSKVCLMNFALLWSTVKKWQVPVIIKRLTSLSSTKWKTVNNHKKSLLFEPTRLLKVPNVISLRCNNCMEEVWDCRCNSVLDILFRSWMYCTVLIETLKILVLWSQIQITNTKNYFSFLLKLQDLTGIGDTTKKNEYGSPGHPAWSQQWKPIRTRGEHITSLTVLTGGK